MNAQLDREMDSLVNSLNDQLTQDFGKTGLSHRQVPRMPAQSLEPATRRPALHELDAATAAVAGVRKALQELSLQLVGPMPDSTEGTDVSPTESTAVFDRVRAHAQLLGALSGDMRNLIEHIQRRM